MDLSASTLWLLVAAALVLAELATGTFYLLMLALGAAGAAAVAWAGAGVVGQLLTAAAVGGGAVVVWHRRRTLSASTAPSASNRDLNLDVGSHVNVGHWEQDGRTQVHYRGSQWAAEFRGAGPPAPGEHVIAAVESNHLVLTRPTR